MGKLKLREGTEFSKVIKVAHYKVGNKFNVFLTIKIILKFCLLLSGNWLCILSRRQVLTKDSEKIIAPTSKGNWHH